MVGLAGVAKTLGKIVWANAVEVDARHRENGVEVVQHGASDRNVLAQQTLPPVAGN
jgi:hypothetical protein